MIAILQLPTTQEILLLCIHVYPTSTGDWLGEVLHLLLNAFVCACVQPCLNTQEDISGDILHPLHRKFTITILHINVYHSYVLEVS